MTHPYFTGEYARQRQADMLAQAAAHHLARSARSTRSQPANRDRVRAIGTAVTSAMGWRRHHDRAVEPTVNMVTTHYSRAGAVLPANREKPAPVPGQSATDRARSEAEAAVKTG